MTIEEIRELLGLFNESGVAELEVQRGENRVRLKRASLNHEYVVAAPAPSAAAMYAAQASPVVAAPSMSPFSVAAGGASAAGTAPAVDATEKHELVKSPIVGTYYDAASPGAPPFVKVGDQVEKGQVLCIIESMKLMNEIEAEIPGTVMAKLVDNGKPVEYGQALFAVKPR
jgi:acetyl-CoA carboxylase biotin carboxyl carrier protein